MRVYVRACVRPCVCVCACVCVCVCARALAGPGRCCTQTTQQRIPIDPTNYCKESYRVRRMVQSMQLVAQACPASLSSSARTNSNSQKTETPLRQLGQDRCIKACYPAPKAPELTEAASLPTGSRGRFGPLYGPHCASNKGHTQD